MEAKCERVTVQSGEDQSSVASRFSLDGRYTSLSLSLSDQLLCVCCKYIPYTPFCVQVAICVFWVYCEGVQYSVSRTYTHSQPARSNNHLMLHKPHQLIAGQHTWLCTVQCVTSVLLILQLLTASLDGKVMIWDYLDGSFLRV